MSNTPDETSASPSVSDVDFKDLYEWEDLINELGPTLCLAGNTFWLEDYYVLMDRISGVRGEVRALLKELKNLHAVMVNSSSK